MLKAVFFSGALAAALCTAAPAAAEPGLRVRNAAVRLTVIAEDRADVQVQLTHANSRLPVEIRRDGDDVIVEGHALASSCFSGGGRSGVRLGWLFPIAEADLPRIIVHMPRDAVISAQRGAVFGEIGATRSLRMGVSSCGRLTLGDVDQRLAINVAGSMSIHGARAGRAELNLAGSGDIALTRLAGDLRARLPGSGELVVDSVRAADVDVAGSGDVRIGAVQSGLAAAIAGSGDIGAASVDGPVDARIVGSGDIRLRQGDASSFRARIVGSGDISYGGTVGNLDASISGSGDIRVRRVTGTVSRRVMGSGDIIIGEQASAAEP